jgi:hypothetical protein
MMTNQSIINAIEKKIGATSFSVWTIGVTNEPDKAKALYENIYGNTRYWEYWEMPTSDDTKQIISYFEAKGMRLNGNHIEENKKQYLYVF